VGISRLDRLRLIHRWGYRSDDFEAYGFTHDRPVEDGPRFLGRTWYFERVRPALNPPAARALTENKWVFYRFADSLGLPVPPTIGLFDRLYGTTWDGARGLRTVGAVLDELAARRPAGLVLKPVGGGQGQNVVILDEIDHATGSVLTRTGQRTTLEEALDGLDLEGVRGVSGYILQEPVSNHDDLRRFAPTTTNTLRVQTILTDDGQVHVQASVARLGRRGRMSDHWHSEGVAVAVDIDTGVMGSGTLMSSPERITEHPDTGVRFTGETVPGWPQTVEVCRRAARSMHGLRSIGWDVVVTPDGPVLLEGNSLWDLAMVQTHSDGFLGDPVLRGQFEDAGAPLPSGRLLPLGAQHTARRAARSAFRRASRSLVRGRR